MEISFIRISGFEYKILNVFWLMRYKSKLKIVAIMAANAAQNNGSFMNSKLLANIKDNKVLLLGLVA